MKISEKLIRESFNCGELLSELPVFIYDKTGSTNTEARTHAENNDTPHALFIANEQSAGRGRRGRSFLSPEGGLYMSLLFRPEGPLSDTTAITAFAAVIVRRAIDELTCLHPTIKWVNDIILNGRKLAGILTEGRFSSDGTALEYCVVGIGINVHGRALPDEIASIATTLELSGAVVSRERLAAHITELFFSELHLAGTRKCADEYRSHCPLVGREITVHKLTESYPAKVTAITDRCELILSLENGKTEILATGEVSIRENA